MSKTISRLLSTKSKVVLQKCDAPPDQPAPALSSNLQLLRNYKIPKLSKRTGGGGISTANPQLPQLGEGEASHTGNSTHSLRETRSPPQLTFEDALKASSALVDHNAIGSKSKSHSTDCAKRKGQDPEEEPMPNKKRKRHATASAAIAEQAKVLSVIETTKKTATRRLSLDSSVSSARESESVGHESGKKKKRRSSHHENVSSSAQADVLCSEKKKRSSSKKHKDRPASSVETSRSDTVQSSSSDPHHNDLEEPSKESTAGNPARSEADASEDPEKRNKINKRKSPKKKERREKQSLDSLINAALARVAASEVVSAPATVEQTEGLSGTISSDPNGKPNTEGNQNEALEVRQESPSSASMEEHCKDPAAAAELHQQQQTLESDTAPASHLPNDPSKQIDETSTEPGRENNPESPKETSAAGIPEERTSEQAAEIRDLSESGTYAEATISVPVDDVSARNELPSSMGNAPAAAEDTPPFDVQDASFAVLTGIKMEPDDDVEYIEERNRPVVTEEECRTSIAEISEKIKDAEKTVAEKRAAIAQLNTRIRQIEEEIEARENAVAPVLREEKEAATLLHQSKLKFDQLQDTLADKQRSEIQQLLELRTHQVAHLELVIKARQNRHTKDPVLDEMIQAADRNVKDAEEQMNATQSEINLLRSRIHVVEEEVKAAQLRKGEASAKLEESYYSVRAALDESVKSKTGERQKFEDEIASLENSVAKMRGQRKDTKLALERILHQKRCEKIKAEVDDDDDDEKDAEQNLRASTARITPAAFARLPEMLDSSLSAVDLPRNSTETADSAAQPSQLIPAAISNAQTYYCPPGFYNPWTCGPAGQQMHFSASSQQQQQQRLLVPYPVQGQQTWQMCVLCSANFAAPCPYCALLVCWNRCMVHHKRHSHPNLP